MTRRTMGKTCLAAVAVLLVFAWLAAPVWLGFLGTFLVASEQPKRADAILVLAGDMDGRRIVKAAELARQGWAPKVYVSGPHPVYGVSEADLAINLAVRQGFDRAVFEALDVPADSTEDEAQGITPVLRARGVKKLIVVTSNYHTGRAGRIWRRVAAGIRVTMVASPDTNFTVGGWWKSRPGRKTAFYEWIKTLTGPLGA
jgi:uncharacterized SAM-binding protein YcdF (DUF218 family)